MAMVRAVVGFQVVVIGVSALMFWINRSGFDNGYGDSCHHGCGHGNPVPTDYVKTSTFGSQYQLF